MDGWTDGWTYGRKCRHGSVTRFESLRRGGLLFRYPHTQTHTHASLFSFPFFTVFFLSFFLSLSHTRRRRRRLSLKALFELTDRHSADDRDLSYSSLRTLPVCVCVCVCACVLQYEMNIK